MKILAESGIVSARKKGKWTYYSICQKGGTYAAGLLRLLIAENKTNNQRRLGKMKQFSIVIDTSCDLPKGYIKEHGIEVLPIPFTLDNEEHDEGDWGKISEKEFYNALRNGGVAKTSQVNPDTFAKSFTEFAKQDKEVLYIILSGALSGTFQSSLISYVDVKEEYPESSIHLVDSISATALNGLLVMMAVKKREEGFSAGETAMWLEERKHHLFGFFTVDDLMYLHRGGRLSKLSAIGGSLLGIKPVLNIQPDGTLSLKDKVRGRSAAFKHMVNQLKKSVDPGKALDTVFITHTDCEEDANKLAGMVKAAVDVRKVEILVMCPVIGAHVGPGAVTLIFEADITREKYEKEVYRK
jgi:DegV family protein with EDD domain